MHQRRIVSSWCWLTIWFIIHLKQNIFFGSLFIRYKTVFCIYRAGNEFICPFIHISVDSMRLLCDNRKYCKQIVNIAHGMQSMEFEVQNTKWQRVSPSIRHTFTHIHNITEIFQWFIWMLKIELYCFSCVHKSKIMPTNTQLCANSSFTRLHHLVNFSRTA